MADNSSQSSTSSTSSMSSSTVLMTSSESSSSLSSFSSSLSSISSSSSSEIKATILSLSVEGISWNRSKFVSSEMASVKTEEGNLLSQSFGIASATFRIGSVSLHLREYQGTSADYAVHVDVRLANTDGSPTSTIFATAQKTASEITWTGWHTFSLTMDETDTPESRKLVIVFWQDGGDEDNYVAWSYAVGAEVGATATYSSNGGATWRLHDGVVRMIRVSKSYDPFASLCSDGVLRSSTAEEFLAEFSNFDDPVIDGGAEHRGSHDGTETVGLEDASSQSGTSSESSGSLSESSQGAGVVISSKKLLVSIVVDNSGSMGWNDRGKNKVIAVSEIVNQIRANYPGEVKFDFVACGAGGIGTPSYGGGSDYSTIKINPNSPTSSYVNNDGTEASLSDSIVACGFSNLENSHTYALQSVKNGDTTLFDGSGIIDPFLGIRATDNVQSVGPISGQIALSVQTLGTGAEVVGSEGSPATIAEVQASGSTQVRRPVVGGRQYAISGLTDTVVPGDTRLPVETPTTFEVGDVLDLVDTENLSTGHVVTAIGATYVDVTPSPLVTFGSYTSDRGGFLQQTAAMGQTIIDTSSQIELLVKDAGNNRKITFFAQTDKGGRFEWDFLPFKDWVKQFVIYADRPQDLVTYLTGDDGKALPPNTRVRYYINNKPHWGTEKKTLIVDVTPITIIQGTDRIFMDDVSEVKLGDEVKLIAGDGSKYGGYLVAEVNDLNMSIRIIPPVLQESIDLVGLEFKTPDEPEKDGGMLDIVFTAIDSSSDFAKRLGTNRLPSDLEQLPVPAGDLNNYNQDRLRWMSGSFDVSAIQRADQPTQAVASIRVMPITYDHLNKLSEQEDKLASVLNQQTLSDEELAELDALEDEYQQIATENPGSLAVIDDESSSDSEANLQEEVSKDYILSPTEAQLGTVTKFTTFTESASLKNIEYENLSFRLGGPPGIGGEEGVTANAYGDPEEGVLAQTYTVYPAVLIKNGLGRVTSRYILNSYPVHFISPIHMFCVPDENKTVTFGPFCCMTEANGEAAKVVYNYVLPGIYAASNNSIRLDYMVYNRSAAVNGAVVRVKIYDSNRDLRQVTNDPWTYVPVLEKEMGTLCPELEKCGLDMFNRHSYEGETADGVNPKTPAQRLNRRTKNSNGSYNWAIDSTFSIPALKDGRPEFIPEATYLPRYTEGGFSISTSQGLASFTIPPIDVVAKLVIVSEVVCPDNPEFSCVRTDYVWVQTPLKLIAHLPVGKSSLDSEKAQRLKSGLDEPPVEASVEMTCFGQPVPDNIVITLEGSIHNRYVEGDYKKVDPSSEYGQQLLDQQAALASLARTFTPASIGAAGASATMNVMMDELMLQQQPWPATPVKPSVGKTINGVASGYLIGPHGLVVMTPESGSGENFVPAHGDTEVFTASASYQPPNARGAFSVSTQPPVEWTSDLTELPDDIFVKITFWSGGVQIDSTQTSGYADGWTTITLVADLPASKNHNFTGSDDPDMWAYACGQLYGRAPVTFNFVCSSSSKSNIPGRTTQFYATRPTDPETGNLLGEEDEMDGLAFGWAAVRLSLCADTTPPIDKKPSNRLCSFPPCSEVFASASMRVLNKGRTARGCPADSEGGCWFINEYGNKAYVNPTIMWENPLKINFSLGGETIPDQFDFIRDGITKNEIWADVTFSGKPIPIVARIHDVRDVDGNPMPMPRLVVSDIYYLDQIWDEEGRLISENQIRDGTLSVEDASPMASLSRTTKNNNHYHSCVIDDITGDGTTTGTFPVETTEHVHLVSNFEVDNSDISGVHNHTLRSIAIVTINPISNKTLNICVEVTVSYDASKSPVSRTASSFICTSLEWFDFWDLQLVYPSVVVLEEDVMTTNSGFGLTAYLTHKVNGEAVLVLDSDQVRVTFDMKAYEITKQDEATGTKSEISVNSVPTFDFDEETQEQSGVAIVEVVATATAGGKVLSKKGKFSLLSSITSTPSIVGLTDEPTDDDIYIAQAIEKTDKVIGASQIYDAIVMAADRLNLWKADNSDWAYSDKLMFLITDGGENLSQRTINQVVSRVNRLSSGGRQPFLATMLFGSPSQYNLALMEKIRGNTDGATVRIPIGYDPSLVPDRVSELFSFGMGKFNSGTYTGIIDVGGTQDNSQIQGDPNSDTPYGSVNTLTGNGAFESVVIDAYVPDGAVMTISFRFSNDGDVWTEWSQEYQMTGTTTIPTEAILARYMQYTIRMAGNRKFESPILRGVKTTYLKPSTDVFFMRSIPLDITADDYVGELTINHAGTLPDRSDITYGMAHHDTPEKSDYAGITRPWFKSNQREVVLTRFNEPTLTNNNKTFTAINGSWPSVAAIDVYLIKSGNEEGILLSKENYILNSKTGTVSMLTSLADGDRIVVDVKPDNVLRLAMKVFNVSKEPVEIAQITTMYNKTKRIRRTSGGNIVRHPIGDEIDDSSSSSSSLSSLS